MDSDFKRPKKQDDPKVHSRVPINDFSDVEIPDKPINSDGNAPKFKKILCIEDEHFISQLYSRALKKAGYEVRVFSDGESALKEALNNEYDIILLDLLLPSMTGMEMLQKMREQGDLKAKIIVTTNLEQNEQDREGLEKQADGYLVKAEVTPKQLVDFLRSLE